MNDDYVKYKDFIKVTNELRDDIEDIRDNHLASIFSAVMNLADQVKNLRWFFLGGIALLGVIMAMLQVFG